MNIAAQTKKGCFHYLTLAVLVVTASTADSFAERLNPGDIVARAYAGLVCIEPDTGIQTIIWPNSYLTGMNSIAVDKAGTVFGIARWVDCDECGEPVCAVVRFDPGTGTYIHLSTGGLLTAPCALTLDARGDVLVANERSVRSSGSDCVIVEYLPASIVRVAAKNGAQTLISTDDLLIEPIGITVGLDGLIYVSDEHAALDRRGAIVCINPDSGAQKLFACEDWLALPRGLTTATSGDLIVARLVGPPALVEVDTHLKDAECWVRDQQPISEGGHFFNPTSLATCNDGSYLVADPAAGAVVRVAYDDATGVYTQQLLTVIQGCYSIAVVPGPSDKDRDGVPDDEDACPETAFGVAVDAKGCSIEQMCPCQARPTGTNWATRKQYLKCVVRAARHFFSDGVITGQQKAAIIAAAKQAPCNR